MNEVKVTFDGWQFYILFLVFLVLKCTGCIGWPWIWVFAPLWMPICAFILLLILWLIVRML